MRYPTVLILIILFASLAFGEQNVNERFSAEYTITESGMSVLDEIQPAWISSLRGEVNLADNLHPKVTVVMRQKSRYEIARDAFVSLKRDCSEEKSGRFVIGSLDHLIELHELLITASESYLKDYETTDDPEVGFQQLGKLHAALLVSIEDRIFKINMFKKLGPGTFTVEAGTFTVGD